MNRNLSVERLIPLREMPSELKRLTDEVSSLIEARADWELIANVKQQHIDQLESDLRRVRLAFSRVVACLADEDCGIEVAREIVAEELVSVQVGQTCDLCGGTGETVDYEDGFDPGSWFGHTQHKVKVPCEGYCIKGRTAR